MIEVDDMVEVSARESADRNFERAAQALGLSDEQKVQLTTPFREVKVAVPVRMDDGSTAKFLTAGKGKALILGVKSECALYQGTASFVPELSAKDK